VARHDGSGFGLGLWIASRLVAAMDGRIAVSSRPGEGSIFTVILPLVAPGQESDAHDRA
jgi:signal transduction histidine kinase